MKLYFDGELKEAYLNTDDRPTLVVAGADADMGPIEVLIGGTGLKLGGLTIGKRFRIKVEEL